MRALRMLRRRPGPAARGRSVRGRRGAAAPGGQQQAHEGRGQRGQEGRCQGLSPHHRLTVPSCTTVSWSRIVIPRRSASEGGRRCHTIEYRARRAAAGTDNVQNTATCPRYACRRARRGPPRRRRWRPGRTCARGPATASGPRGCSVRVHRSRADLDPAEDVPRGERVADLAGRDRECQFAFPEGRARHADGPRQHGPIALHPEGVIVVLAARAARREGHVAALTGLVRGGGSPVLPERLLLSRPCARGVVRKREVVAGAPHAAGVARRASPRTRCPPGRPAEARAPTTPRSPRGTSCTRPRPPARRATAPPKDRRKARGTRGRGPVAPSRTTGGNSRSATHAGGARPGAPRRSPRDSAHRTRHPPPRSPRPWRPAGEAPARGGASPAWREVSLSRPRRAGAARGRARR